MIHDVVIIGAGPAGLTAAIQLKRFGFEPLVVERRGIGGLALNANLVENYPGFPDGISGQELVRLFSQQVASMGINVIMKEAKQLIMHERHLSILTDIGILKARSVVVATGTLPKMLGVSGERQLRGRRIFYEVRDLPRLTCSATVSVIGGGDAAFDYALSVASQAGSVCLIFRNAKPRALDLLVSRVGQRDNIYLYPNRKVARFEVRNTKLVIETTRKAHGGTETNSVACDYALIAIGREANLELLGGAAINENDAVRHGVFFAGDVKRGSTGQVGIAVGDGLMAAENVARYLEDEGNT